MPASTFASHQVFVVRDAPRIRGTWKSRIQKFAIVWGFALALSAVCGDFAQARSLVIESLDEPVSLSGDWRFQPGDDPAWSDPSFDDSGWDELRVPRGWGRQGYRDHSGVGWYRLELDLAGVLADRREDIQIGVQIGEVTSSYELFAGGKRIGGVGALPPEPRMEYDRHRIYTLPTASIAADGQLVLAIRVWRSPYSRRVEGGPTRGPFFIGHREDLITRALMNQIPYLALVAVFAAVGFYHIRIFAEHRRLSEHFWFGVFTLNVAAYSFLRAQWKYSLSDDFVLLKNLEYLSIYLLPAIGIQMVSGLFSRPIGRWLRAYQLSFIALAAIAALTPDLRFNLLTISWVQLWMLPMIVYAGIVGVQEYRRGNPQAKLWSSVFFLGTCLFDIAADQDWVRGPRMIPAGMVVMILSMAASLANRLVRAHRELESLASSLEVRVDQQTSRLRDRSEQLEQKNRELEQAQVSLREASLTDPLTGLNNRRFLSEYLPHDVACVLRQHQQTNADSARPERADLIFLLMDLDHFKEVNDHYGHDAGDRVLRQTAAIIREICRKSDFAVRWGGDEFLMVSRFSDRFGAATLAGRICTAVAEQTFTLAVGVAVRQSCSIGFASLPLLKGRPEAFRWQAVVDVADRALYAAKENGRNGWVGVSAAAGDPDEGLERRIREDFAGCISRGEIQCQTSDPYGEFESTEAEKDES